LYQKEETKNSCVFLLSCEIAFGMTFIWQKNINERWKMSTIKKRWN